MNLSRYSLLSLSVVALCIGCNGEAPEAVDPKTDEETPAVVPAEVQTDERVTSIMRPKLPEDVFFDDPLAIASNRTLVPGMTETSRSPSAGSTAAAMQTPPTATPQEPKKSVEWATLLPADLLVAEVDRIRERFSSKLDSVATFNGSLLDFPPYAAELAALAGIATEHSGDIPWKQNAKYVRDLASEMLSDQLQRGQKSYEQINGPFKKILPLLEGKRPDGLPEADDATDFAMTADFGYLMRRFEAGQNYLRTTGGSESVFKQNAADLRRETRVLAALSEVVAADDYGYGEDPKFQGYASGMTKWSLDAAAAAEAGDFQKFDLSVSSMMQSCTQCHQEYRNN